MSHEYYGDIFFKLNTIFKNCCYLKLKSSFEIFYLYWYPNLLQKYSQQYKKMYFVVKYINTVIPEAIYERSVSVDEICITSRMFFNCFILNTPTIF